MHRHIARVHKHTSSRPGKIVLCLLALLSTYFLGSRAIDTGSLQQYGLTFIMLGYSIYFLIAAIRNK
jgi:hypothetical protein